MIAFYQFRITLLVFLLAIIVIPASWGVTKHRGLRGLRGWKAGKCAGRAQRVRRKFDRVWVVARIPLLPLAGGHKIRAISEYVFTQLRVAPPPTSRREPFGRGQQPRG